KKRLIAWAGEDHDKKLVFRESIKIMKIFRDFCLNNQVIDYSLLIDLYNNKLLKNDSYLHYLDKRFEYLFIDDLESSVPAAIKLFERLEKKTDSYMTFNNEAGINRFFGANPILAKNKFFKKAEIISLNKSYTSSKEARNLAEEFEEKVFADKDYINTNYIKAEVETEFRGNMLINAAQKVIEIIEEGMKANEIALIAPKIDKVMEFSFDHYFKKRGYELFNLKPSKRLVDIPFAQALISLTVLTNPKWELDLDYSSLHQSISILLDLDPIRSALITEEVFKNSYNLPKISELTLRDRIGFKKAEKYDFLRNWINDKKDKNIEVAHFFQMVFGELLAPLSPDEEDVLACRQMIDSVKKFRDVVKSFKDFNQKELGKDFIELIYNGTIAAEVLYNNKIKENNIILSTPYKFLLNNQIESVKYIFFLDISSNSWLKSIAKELSNPYLFSPQWKNSQKWDDELDQQLRKKQLVDFFQSIISKSKEGIYLVDSYLNSKGWEQEGEFYKWLKDYEVVKDD
ncbi:MAG: UvrD-helicase domain-containing protein, partial [Bacillota bacterium]